MGAVLSTRGKDVKDRDPGSKPIPVTWNKLRVSKVTVGTEKGSNGVTHYENGPSVGWEPDPRTGDGSVRSVRESPRDNWSRQSPGTDLLKDGKGRTELKRPQTGFGSSRKEKRHLLRVDWLIDTSIKLYHYKKSH